MKDLIKINDFAKDDFDDFVEMSHKLWKDIDIFQLKDLLSKSINSDKNKILIAKDNNGVCVAFSIFSIRFEYIEGSYNSPTGYLEGIYVEPEFRKLGIAREFMKIGENWCKRNNCKQIGSDTWLNDLESRNFHKKVGFWEEEEVVHFLKNI